MEPRPQGPPMVFLDFDGTVTCRDVTDAILEVFADPAWRAIEAEWKAGRIGSRECLRRQMALVRADPERVTRLIDDIEVDPGFARVLAVCQSNEMPVAIVSDGFDYCIDRILQRPSLALAALLRQVPIRASRLTYEDGAWRVGFASDTTCAHGCATCKPAMMSQLNTEMRPPVFVGDGLSDRYAAAQAAVVLAKGELADYCRLEAIACIEYDHLAHVAARLGDWRRLLPGEDGRRCTGGA